MQPEFDIHALAQRIKERAAASPDVSYTRKLLDRGVAQCTKKLGEEAVETVIAALSESRERVVSEAADLLYHLLVVLEARGIALSEVERELSQRSRISGIEEKNARPRS